LNANLLAILIHCPRERRFIGVGLCYSPEVTASDHSTVDKASIFLESDRLLG
jgi:hypothetical protein